MKKITSLLLLSLVFANNSFGTSFGLNQKMRFLEQIESELDDKNDSSEHEKKNKQDVFASLSNTKKILLDIQEKCKKNIKNEAILLELLDEYNKEMNALKEKYQLLVSTQKKQKEDETISTTGTVSISAINTLNTPPKDKKLKKTFGLTNEEFNQNLFPEIAGEGTVSNKTPCNNNAFGIYKE